MSFVAGFDKLDAAFVSGQGVEVATLGDVFRPNEEMPDLSVPIGSKIERTAELSVPSQAGELAVAIMCRVVRPDISMCEGIVPIEHFSTRTYEPKPTMTAKQTIEWSEESGDHHSRLFTGFSRLTLENDDQEWRAYQEQLEALEALDWSMRRFDDEPFKPFSLMYNLVSDFPVIKVVKPEDLDGSHSKRRGDAFYDDPSDHFGTLGEVVERFSPLGHIASRDVYGKDIVIHQTPQQFEAHVDWLLTSEK